MASPDGRVDPGGTTWKRLNGPGPSLVQLPQVCGKGYYSYENGNRQYGTAATIQALIDVAVTFVHNQPGVEIGIGDISLAPGGPISGHQSHQQGTNVDIRPFRSDREHKPVTYQDAKYDREQTRLLVQSLLAHRNVRSILFNDAQIRGVQSWPGHDNHLHVNMKE